VLALPHDPNLHEYSTRFEKTTYPAEFLFGPGTWEEVRDWILTNEPTADAVDYLDRTFVVRQGDGQVDLPRRPEVAAALPSASAQAPGTYSEPTTPTRPTTTFEAQEEPPSTIVPK
jgi:hypothetical protein